MGLQNLLEPGAIVAIFTAGTLINQRPNIRPPSPSCVESSLLADDTEEPKLADEALNTRSVEIYQGLRAVSARTISGNQAIFDKAELHAIQILTLESFFHIDIELSFQQFVLEKAPGLVPFLARVYYSHIVLGVIFLVYCYTFVQRDKFQGIRRTLALANVIAFTILTTWRCMPPRLLPEEQGFIDILHSNAGGSAWTQNKFQLTIAAMPSLHFGNSVFIALCLLRFSPHWYLRVIAPLWPMLMGLTIVATANHFILDAVVGACVVLTAYRFNQVMLVLLPVERVLSRPLRLKKP